uniref:7TM_GPCR_Srx domain-containing protein n=1 Tax=Parastrongyloides trichosuri TaxID=131310 RepID=A0A0N4ZCR4_PARTI
MVKSTNVSRFDMIVDIFDLNQFRHFRQTEMTTDRVDQLFLFDGLTPATWFALRIQYRLHHRYPGVKSDITTKQDLIFKTKSNMVNDDTVSDEKIIYLDNIVSRPDQLDVSIKSAFDNEPRIKVVVVPELILCDRGVIKANAIQLNHSSVTVINFDLKKANLRQNLIHSNSKNVPYEYHHHACSTLCIYPYIKTIIEQKDELFRGMACNLDLLTLIYILPTLSFMIIVAQQSILKIVKSDVIFCNEFYPIVCLRTINDILYHVAIFVFIKLPKWGLVCDLFKKYKIMAKICFFIGAFCVCETFLYTFFVSVIRFAAIKHPISYQTMFSYGTIKKIIIFMIIFGASLSAITIFYDSCYVFNEENIIIVPIFLNSNIIYFQIIYSIFIYGTLIVASLCLNVLSVYTLCLRRKRRQCINKIEVLYATYSIFTFLTSLLMEFYFVMRIIGNASNVNTSLIAQANLNLLWIGDIISFGDFYFLLITSSYIRNLIYSWFKNTFTLRPQTSETYSL